MGQTTTFDDPDDGMEVFWDDLEEWERTQLFLDGWAEDEYDDFTPDAYDQYEYMLDHQDEE